MDQVMWVGPRRRPRFYVLGVAILIAVAAVSVVVTSGRSTASAAKPGYSCLSPAKLGSGSLDPLTVLHVRFDGFTLTLSVPKSSPGPAQPIDLVVSDAASQWVVPKPIDLQTRSIDELCLVRFHQGSVPDVIMEGFSGGAHCCQQPVFYAFDGSHRRYDKVVDLTAPKSTLGVAWDDNGGFEPMKVGDQILLRTEDDHFAYAFGCFACTPMPIQLDSFGDSGLTNVTGQHPLIIGREAAQLKGLSLSQAADEKRTGTGPFGPLAAFVADECALGRGAEAWTTVRDLQKTGKLDNELFYANTLTTGSFVAKLQTFLVKGEYCVGQIG
jgi:hypothetical protein